MAFNSSNKDLYRQYLYQNNMIDPTGDDYTDPHPAFLNAVGQSTSQASGPFDIPEGWQSSYQSTGNQENKKAKKKIEVSMTDEVLEKKDTSIDEKGDTTTIIEKTNLDETWNGSSIADNVLSFLGFGSANAEDPPQSLETPIPTEANASFTGDGFPYVDDSNNLVPKYITDGSGATILNPEWTEETGETRETREQDELNSAIRRTDQVTTQEAWENMQTLNPLYTEGDLVYDEETDTFALPNGRRIGDKIPLAEMFKAEVEKIRAKRKIEEAGLLDTTELPIVGANNKQVEKAIETIIEENPKGIDELNHFATWADGVSDAESQRAAKEYLEELKDEPTVKDRYKKAMAIAFAAMLFGDDFATAMNTGMGVIADDYATEAAEDKAESDAQIALNKKISEEMRALNIDDYKSERDSAESLTNSILLANHKAKIKAIEDGITYKSELHKENVAEGQKIMASIKASMAGDDAVMNFMNRNDMDGEMSGLLEVLQPAPNGLAPKGFVVDWNEPSQRTALSGILNKWIRERVRFGDNAAPLAAYASEMFVKTDLEEFAGIDPQLIAPTYAHLESRPFVGPVKEDGTREQHYVNMDNLDILHQGTKTGTEMTLKLGKEIQRLGGGDGGLGEKWTTALLWKDFQDFKKQSYASKGKLLDDPFTKMEKIAYNKGVGPFTQFVLVHLAGNNMLNDRTIGMNFDSSLKGESLEVQNAALKSYLDTGEYDLAKVKAAMKK
tara:strand:+ start:652 stop:2838 length:2187 start_codon:yes stop_codon:yes gene_type:complete